MHNAYKHWRHELEPELERRKMPRNDEEDQQPTTRDYEAAYNYPEETDYNNQEFRRLNPQLFQDDQPEEDCEEEPFYPEDPRDIYNEFF